MKDDAPLDDARLVHVARGLGSHAADRLDVEGVVRAVLGRWRAEPAPAARGPQLGFAPVWLRIAAAFVIVVGGGLLVRAVWQGGAHDLAVPVEVVDLSDLSSGELNELLRTQAEPASAEPVSSLEVGLEDLSVPQLRVLLASIGA
jgi:hypothetical protein